MFFYMEYVKQLRRVTFAMLKNRIELSKFWSIQSVHFIRVSKNVFVNTNFTCKICTKIVSNFMTYQLAYGNLRSDCILKLY